MRLPQYPFRMPRGVSNCEKRLFSAMGWQVATAELCAVENISPLSFQVHSFVRRTVPSRLWRKTAVKSATPGAFSRDTKVL